MGPPPRSTDARIAPVTPDGARRRGRGRLRSLLQRAHAGATPHRGGRDVVWINLAASRCRSARRRWRLDGDDHGGLPYEPQAAAARLENRVPPPDARGWPGPGDPCAVPVAEATVGHGSDADPEPRGHRQGEAV